MISDSDVKRIYILALKYNYTIIQYKIPCISLAGIRLLHPIFVKLMLY